MLKIGNSKLDKIIAIFDLPAIETCPNCQLCAETCYAMKAQRQYPNVKKWRDNNYILSQSFDFEGLIMDELKKIMHKIQYVRIHSSGDFYNNQYFRKWVNIARHCPSIIFYAYTKADIYDNDIPENLIIHKSLVNGQLNYGTLETLKNQCNGFICPDTLGHNGIQCGKTCTFCMQKTDKQILFIKH